jgi:hypothetical protein
MVTYVGLDAHARSTHAAAIDVSTGELLRARFGPGIEEPVAWLAGLPGPVQLLEATITAHEQEMAERADALARELWLQRLTQLGKVQELLGEAVEAAHSEIRKRELGSPAIMRIGSTLLSSALLRV